MNISGRIVCKELKWGVSNEKWRIVMLPNFQNV